MDLLNDDDDDPIVAEVRRIRVEIAAECDYDIDRIFDHCREAAKRPEKQRAARRAAVAEGRDPPQYDLDEITAIRPVASRSPDR